MEFAPPINAIAWRVRRVKHRHKGFDIVTVHNPHLGGWVPLVIRLRATFSELWQALDGVGGLYRLDPIDEQRRVLAWTAAYVPIPPKHSHHSNDPHDRGYEYVNYFTCNVK